MTRVLKSAAICGQWELKVRVSLEAYGDNAGWGPFIIEHVPVLCRRFLEQAAGLAGSQAESALQLLCVYSGSRDPCGQG